MADVSLSRREMEILAHAWTQIAVINPKIDYAQLASDAGYTSAPSARVAWNNVRRKLTAPLEGSASAVSTTPKTPKSGTKRGAPTKDGDETPTKNSRAKGASGKKTKSSAATNGDVEHQDEDGGKLEGLKVEIKVEAKEEEDEQSLFQGILV